MYKKTAFYLFFLITYSTYSQIVSIPGFQFRQALLNHFPVIDLNRNQEIEVSEAIQVQVLNITDQNVRDITGIKSFVNLKTLNASSNKISIVDLADMNNLETVNITAPDANNGAAFSIDLSNCTKLISFYSDFNATRSINLKNCSALETLVINTNTYLNAIDLSDCVNLKYLSVNNTDLASLNVSTNRKLTYLSCSQLNFLGSSTFNGILNLSNNLLLEEFNCFFNRFTNLDFSSNTKLKRLNCANNKLLNLDLSTNSDLEKLECENNSLTGLNLSNCPKLKELSCSDNKLTTLNTASLVLLENLNCKNNLISSLNLSSNTLLFQIEAQNNKISSINFSSNPVLRNLWLNDNVLTTLDLSSNLGLYWLDITNNKVINLDLRTNTILGILRCSNNLIDEIQFSNTTYQSLGIVVCNDNFLKKIDLSQAVSLHFFECQNNPLLRYINLLNGSEEGFYSYSRFNFRNNPLLRFMCVDDFQLNAVKDSLVKYNMNRTKVSFNCDTTSTLWNGTKWSDGVPDINLNAIIAGNYSTLNQGNIVSKELTINPGIRLFVAPNNTVTITGIITNNGEIYSCKKNNVIGTIIGNNIVQDSIPVFILKPTDQVVIDGNMADFQAFASLNATNYEWKEGNTVVGLGGSFQIRPTINSNGKVFRIVVSNSCGSDSVSAKLNVINTPILSTTSPVKICKGQFADLTKSYFDSESSFGTISFWEDANESNLLTNPSQISISGTYFIKKEITSTGSSFSTIKPIEVIASTFEVPTLSISGNNNTCFENPVSLTISGANSYLWKPSNSTQNTFTTTTAGVYTVVGFNSDECFVEYSATVTSVNCILQNIKTYEEENALTIYPNPAFNKIFIGSKNLKIVNITLLNNVGGNVIHTNNNEIDVSTIENGVYIIKVETKTKTYIQKILVIH